MFLLHINIYVTNLKLLGMNRSQSIILNSLGLPNDLETIILQSRFLFIYNIFNLLAQSKHLLVQVSTLLPYYTKMRM